jgi:selenide,water dikinase
VLRPLQSIFDPAEYPDLTVGLQGPDDAAVWRMGEGRLLVVTTDFFTPVVDDPYDYGAIAACNAMSDVYAMGAKPFLCLNIAAVPPALPIGIFAEIIRGGAEMTRRAGAVVAGGHSIQDEEPKYGLVVLGFAQEGKLMVKAGARPGDRLVITKPLGTGVTTTALKQDKVKSEHLMEAVDWMKRLNAEAAMLALDAGVQAATDITGFGLLGHSLELAQASGVGLRMDFTRIPFLSGARTYVEKGCIAGGTADNKQAFESHVAFDESIDDYDRLLLFDAQTSGGLLLAVPEKSMHGFQMAAEAHSQPMWVIGEVVPGTGIQVTG